MARRRRLEPLNEDDLARVRADAASRHDARPSIGALGAAPIAQIASDSMAEQKREIDRLREEAMAARADAGRMIEAEARGLLLTDVDLRDIDVDYLSRDRLPAAVEDDAWRALRNSIQAHGQRTPIELAPILEGRTPYGLIAGYRRIAALQRLWEETGDPRWRTVRAIVRTPTTLGQAFLCMVEENEIRQNLGFFERGRICLRAVEQGAFPSTEAAVEALFSAASPAKRSKVRSFVLLVEELGDLLQHPRDLGERLGLRLAMAIKAGQGGALRRLVGEHGAIVASPEHEQALLARCLDHLRRPPTTGGAAHAALPAASTEAGLGLALRLRKRSDGVTFTLIGVISDEEVAVASTALLDAVRRKRGADPT